METKSDWSASDRMISVFRSIPSAFTRISSTKWPFSRNGYRWHLGCCTIDPLISILLKIRRFISFHLQKIHRKSHKMSWNFVSITWKSIKLPRESQKSPRNPCNWIKNPENPKESLENLTKCIEISFQLLENPPNCLKNPENPPEIPKNPSKISKNLLNFRSIIYQ